MPPHPPIAVSILTGFLGAGKTTLLNRLLKEPGMEGTAVIVNELGDVSIDHMLVEQASEGIVELAGGCLCCAVRGELVDTLADLVDRVQTGSLPPLKRIAIETTGLADPVPVLQSVMGHPALAQALRLDGVTCVVDAVEGVAALDGHEEAARQVAVADRLVITKTDLAGGAPGALRERLRGLNPRAEIVEAGQAAAMGAALLSCGLYDPETRKADLSRWLGEAEVHDHDHHHDHGHHHHHRIRAFSLAHDRPVPFSTVEAFLDLLRATQGERLLRMKGVIELAEDRDRPLVIHGVRTLMHPPGRLAAWPEGARGTRLVIIAQDADEDYVRRLFSAFMGEPAVDAPDRAALQDNPLAVPGFRA